MKFLILDIETNGIGTFRPATQTPIQVSFQLVNDEGETLIDYSEFIKGVKAIKWGGSIGECPWTVDYVNSVGVPISSCIASIKDALDDDTIIVGHNIEFDISALMNTRHSKTITIAKQICTMKRSVEFCKIPSKYKYSAYKWPKLIELANSLDIEVDDSKFHDSVYDVEITKQCFLSLLRMGEITPTGS